MLEPIATLQSVQFGGNSSQSGREVQSAYERAGGHTPKYGFIQFKTESETQGEKEITLEASGKVCDVTKVPLSSATVSAGRGPCLTCLEEQNPLHTHETEHLES